MATSSIDSNTAAQLITGGIFGVAAIIIGIVTIYQGRRAWKMWREHTTTTPPPPTLPPIQQRNLGTELQDLESGMGGGAVFAATSDSDVAVNNDPPASPSMNQEEHISSLAQETETELEL